jgi:putative tricarboxylic transport membrane protein
MRSLAIRFAFILALLAGALPVAQAQSDARVAYPQSRVTLVTHSSPGGGSDLFLRDLAKHLGPIMGVRFTSTASRTTKSYRWLTPRGASVH